MSNKLVSEVEKKNTKKNTKKPSFIYRLQFYVFQTVL